MLTRYESIDISVSVYKSVIVQKSDLIQRQLVQANSCWRLASANWCKIFFDQKFDFPIANIFSVWSSVKGKFYLPTKSVGNNKIIFLLPTNFIGK